MYVVTGATGNIGSLIAETLIAEGKKVRAIGRSEERLASLVEQGAETAVGSMSDADFMNKVFEGAEAVFAMLPPKMDAEDFRAHQNGISDIMKAAIEKNDVKNIVVLSSIAAQVPEGSGPIEALHDMEQKFNTIEGANVLHLRPSFFMENFFMQVDAIKHMGVMTSPAAGNYPMPIIATKDIAAYASQRLLALDFEGKSALELLGERDVSNDEAAKILGKAIGMDDLKYAQAQYADAEKMMLQMGASEDMSKTYVQMYRAFNEGKAHKLEDRTEANTTPTSIEEFASVFAAVYAS